MRALALVLSLVLCACGDDDDGVDLDASLDSGTAIDRDGDVDATTDALVIATPAAPVLTPCPPGWTTRATTPPTCEPWAGDALALCARNQARFPGDPACAVIGTACPAGDFPTVAAGTDAIYVKAGVTGGAGTLASPYGRIDQADASARVGSVIVLSRGLHPVGTITKSSVRVLGACTLDTQISGTSTLAPLTITGADVTVENLQTVWGPHGILGSGPSVTLRSVLVFRAVGIGVLLTGGTNRMSDVMVRDGMANAIAVDTGARLEATRLAVYNTGMQPALNVSGGASLSLSDSVLSNNGWLLISANATGALARVLSEDGDGIQSNGGLTATDVLVRRSVAGFTLSGTATLQRVTVEDARNAGFVSFGTASVTDAVVRVTGTDPAFKDGNGMLTFDSQQTLSRVWFERARAGGIIAFNDARVTATDLTIRDVLAPPCTLPGGVDCPAFRDFGVGLGAYAGASVAVRRFEITRSLLAGVQVGVLGVMDLHDGEISGSVVGANVQNPGLPAQRISDHVIYRGNGINLDTANLPLPPNLP